MANLLKNISFDLLQNGPKYTSRTNLHFDIDLGDELISPQAKLFFGTWAPSHWEKLTGTPEDALEGFKWP